jgi:hypothetical protein
MAFWNWNGEVKSSRSEAVYPISLMGAILGNGYKEMHEI